MKCGVCNIPFFEQTILKKCIKMDTKLLKLLYIEWKHTKDEEIFLILYAYAWYLAEDIYCEDPAGFYNKNIYEKLLFFELLDYGKKYMMKNVKFLLLTGYMYSTTEYYFWGDADCIVGDREEEGKKIISKLYARDSESFVISYFYGMIYGFKNMGKYCEKEKIKENIHILFPSYAGIDTYFREILE